MEKMKVLKFLKEANCFPIEKWDSFEIIHLAPKNNLERNDCYKYIKSKVQNKNGLYIYKKDDRIIYIGKGKPLYNRLKNHYQSSFEEVSGDTKDKIWHKFFKKYRGKLKVYWKEQEDERIRQIIEKMLDCCLNPEFNNFKEKVKTKRKKSKTYAQETN